MSRDCEHGRRTGNCDTCDLAEAEKMFDNLQIENASLYALLADIRQACGDDGKRMQDELVQYIADLFINANERDALAAQLEQLNKLHSDLTSADMVFDDGEHSGYLITSEQLEEFEFILGEPAQCLAEIKAQAVEEAVVSCGNNSECVRLPNGYYCSEQYLFNYANQLRQQAKAGE